jgi:Protein of unknown function (DUF2934)
MKQELQVTLNADSQAIRAAPCTAAALPMRIESGHDIKLVNTNLSETVLSHPSREQLIAEAAYHHAEARSFEPGHELDDWLAAEADVAARLDGEGCGY